MANEKDITVGQVSLGSLVKAVETELTTMLKAEEAAEAAALAKARPGEETSSEASASPATSASDPKGDNTSAASASPDSDSPADASASAAPDASASASPADASAGGPPAAADGSAPPDASAAPGGDAGADPAAQQGPIDPAQLAAEYAQMPLEDLKAHYYALKEVLFQATGAAGGDGSASAAPADASAAAGAPPAPGPDASASAAPAIKAEIPSGDKLSNPGPANGEDAAKLHKAEPTRAEVRAQLRQVVADRGTKLSKSERNAIINFDLGRVKMDDPTIAALLKGEVAAPAAPAAKAPAKAAPVAPAPAAKVEEKVMSKAEADELKLTVDRLTAVVTKLGEVGVRKSVQFAADLGKSETPAAPTMNRTEARAKLHDRIAEGKLSKSDREAIMAFELNKVGIDKVAHLLK